MTTETIDARFEEYLGQINQLLCLIEDLETAKQNVQALVDAMAAALQGETK